jgi:chloride channel protein, CIC family
MRAGLSPFMVWGSSAKRLLEGETVGNSDPPFEERLEPSGLTRLVALALVVGAGAGLFGAALRAALGSADRFRNALIASQRDQPIAGFLLVVGVCAAATLVSAWLVRRFARHASGSGIPHVEAVLSGLLPPAEYALLPVKFVGGVLAIGAGLALGREGPSVQLGAGVGVFVGRTFRLSWPDCRALCAAGAGAGIATAFNAPVTGGVFVLEELVQRFEPRIAMTALAASAAAIGVSRALLGDTPDFDVAPLPTVGAGALPAFYALGVVAGLIAVAYNRALLATLAAVERVPLPVEARAGLIGGAVGALAWFGPGLVGGGDAITQSALSGTGSLEIVALVFLIRFCLGAISYAAATPGGLFAPMLVLGAQSGLLFGAACRWAFPTLDVPIESFAVVGMAAFFTGVVRAPLTGIVLAAELTDNVSLFHPMLGACAIAMLIPTLLRNQPIYDSLRDALLRLERRRAAAVTGGAAAADASPEGAEAP